ncbi:MAG: hypothetical protein EOP56_05215 [Sphingobacteriales bacterium]|nr:MAG: hypothetical protein EOP56_05215 [Sphingobacteriales bacterium]
MKTTVRQLLFLLLLLCACRILHAQEFEQISTRQGLPHNVVSSLYQDKEGYIWVGTYNGLCRYEGNKIKIFNNIFDSAQTQDWHQAIEIIFEDSHDNIWAGTKGGRICCFVRKDQTWKIFNTTSGSSNAASCFFEDKSKRLWFGTMNGAVAFIHNDSIKTFKITNNTIRCIGSRGDGTLNIFSENGAFLLNVKAGIVTRLPWPHDDYYFNIYCHCTPDNHVFIEDVSHTSLLNLSKLNEKVRIPIPKSFPFRATRKSALSPQGSYYLTDLSQINEYNSSGTLINSIQLTDLAALSQSNQVINCILADRNEILWIGTNSGLLKIDKNKYRFKRYSKNNISNKLTDNYVRTVYADRQNNIWVGFKSGKVNKLFYDSLKSSYVLQKSFKMHHSEITEQYTVNAMLQLKSGVVINGCREGLFMVNDRTSVLEPYLHDTDTSRIRSIWSLYQDKEGWLWIGTKGNGLFLVDPHLKQKYHYKHTKNSLRSLPDNNIWNIYEDHKGYVWLLTNNSVAQVNPNLDKSNLHFNWLELNKEISEPIPTWNMQEDDSGNLWVTTTGFGLYKINKNRTVVKPETSFPRKVISGILPNHNGLLWISTMNGLYLYDPVHKTYIAYDESDGLLSNDFNFKAAAVSSTGYLFFGTKMGLISFQPGSVSVKKNIHVPVYINTLQINGNDSTGLLYQRSEFELSRQQNALQFTFSIPDYSKPHAHRYRYILQGFDTKWNTTDAIQPLAMYTNIPPGHYTLVVEGSIDGINWSRHKDYISFFIRPAIWQMPLFWVSAGIALVVFACFLIYRRVTALVNQEREKHRIEKQIASLELNALQSQMNPHFIFNSLNAIQHYILHSDDLAANEYLSRFARLMRLFLESSKNKYISLADELELLDLYMSLEKLRFEDKFDYTLSLGGNCIREMLIPSMMIQPFVENAINHGLLHLSSKGLLNVTFSCNEQEGILQCTIDDNGIGREKATAIKATLNKQHISRGMQLIKERVKTYNFLEDSDIDILITDKTHPEEGTIVRISIPTHPALKKAPSYDKSNYY